MNRKAVEEKLERIHTKAELALDLIVYGFKEENLFMVKRYLNAILAASEPWATRNLNFIPDPIDEDRGDEEKEAAKEPDGSEGYEHQHPLAEIINAEFDTPMADSEPYDPADCPF